MLRAQWISCGVLEDNAGSITDNGSQDYEVLKGINDSIRGHMEWFGLRIYGSKVFALLGRWKSSGKCFFRTQKEAIIQRQQRLWLMVPAEFGNMRFLSGTGFKGDMERSWGLPCHCERLGKPLVKVQLQQQWNHQDWRGHGDRLKLETIFLRIPEKNLWKIKCSQVAGETQAFLKCPCHGQNAKESSSCGMDPAWS